ncbi:HNH endonuclease signature motif containing protein [Methylomonas koyamae]|uniref:HNH endonuclease signature motif containing protein n=1 Tax=Methylomonas koyamae TaxID=702114 RepID=UPI001E3BBDD0|nr:HNH endonuclease signature motif containing protein [Methylomonas koyamae]
MKKLSILLVALLLATTTSPLTAQQKRSEAAKGAFKRMNPCPANGRTSGSCPGYVIDHIRPLACGGADDPSNMQWQTVSAGKAKDGWERKGCQSVSSPATSGDYHQGPKGGCYTYARGKKVYVDHSLCWR